MKSIAQIQAHSNVWHKKLAEEATKNPVRHEGGRIDELEYLTQAFVEVLKDPTELAVLRLYYGVCRSQAYQNGGMSARMAVDVYGWVLEE